jgi:hypothetical protein
MNNFNSFFKRNQSQQQEDPGFERTNRNKEENSKNLPLLLANKSYTAIVFVFTLGGGQRICGNEHRSGQEGRIVEKLNRIFSPFCDIAPGTREVVPWGSVLAILTMVVEMPKPISVRPPGCGRAGY